MDSNIGYLLQDENEISKGDQGYSKVATSYSGAGYNLGIGLQFQNGRLILNWAIRGIFQGLSKKQSVRVHDNDPIYPDQNEKLKAKAPDIWPYALLGFSFGFLI